MSSNQRCFQNPYKDYENEVEVSINPSGIKMHAMHLVQQIFRNAEDMDGGIYVGAGGCAYMYIHIVSMLTEDEKLETLPLAKKAIESQIAYYDMMFAKRKSKSDLVGFLLGKAGVNAVGAVLSKETDDTEVGTKCLKEFVDAAIICKPIDFFKAGSDELLVGRAGYLFAALWLQQKLGYQPVPRNDLKDIWNVMVESGQNYAVRNKSKSPLMYSYYGTEYLGAAHGVSGIIQALLSFPVFLQENPTASALIKDTLDYYLTLQDADGNFPSAMDDAGPRKTHELVHFCHGAPGAIYMFAKAYLHFKEEKYLDACLKCGEIVWKRGLLKKGPGICHGVAGNGYVFLVLYNLTGKKDPKHLYRAYKFAEFLTNPQFVKEARRPDCPFSLYEGSSGTVCFLADVINPSHAEFPFFNLYNNYASKV